MIKRVNTISKLADELGEKNIIPIADWCLFLDGMKIMKNFPRQKLTRRLRSTEIMFTSDGEIL